MAADEVAAAAAADSGSAGDPSPAELLRQLNDLRALVARQAEEQREAVSLIMEQQQTIQTLEERLAAGGCGAVARPVAPPLDGPAAVMEPSPLDRPVLGSYNDGPQPTRW